MSKTFGFFMAIVVFSLFYGFGSTILAYTIAPYGADSNTVDSYSIEGVNASDVADRTASAMQNQLNIPIIDAGALLFYTGNILIDLMMNSFFAFPSLITILINGFMIFFSFDAVIAMQIKIIFFAFASVIYFINIIGFLMQLRGQGAMII